MSAVALSGRDAYLSMTGAQYSAYLESLMTEGAANAPKVLSAAEFVDAEECQRLADKANDRATQVRDRIKALKGDKAAAFFETLARGMQSADKFASAPDSDPEWQVKGLIPRTGSGLHTGSSGTLKSFAEIHLGAQVHQNGGKALMVVAEGARGYKRRLRAYAEHHDIALADMPTVLPMAVNLFEPTEVTALIEAIKLVCPDVTYISFDTKWRCALGAEENSATDQAKVFAQIERLAKEFNCFVMCVAHLGKDKDKGVRGSSSQYAAVDVELTQERTGDFCTMTATKMKDFEDGTVHTFKVCKVELGFNAHGEPETSLALEPAAAAERAAAVKAPRGKYERALWEHAQKLAGSFSEEAIVADVTDALRKTGADVRAATVRRALKGMIGEYFTQYGEELAVRAPIIRDNAGWLGE